MTSWDGDAYQRRFDALAAQGVAVHGEADFVSRLVPHRVLDAGCGTGRVAIELARRGIDVVGVDLDPSMLAAARAAAPAITWIEHDLAHLELDGSFDVVLMAGNVLLFTSPGAQPAVVEGCARHVQKTGVLVTGFQLGRGYELDRFDADCSAVGLELTARYATWDREPYEGGDYAVSIHRSIRRYRGR